MHYYCNTHTLIWVCAHTYTYTYTRACTTARSFAKLNKDDAEEEEEVEVTLDSFEPVMSLEWHEDPGIGGDTLPDPLTFDERLRDFSQAYTRFQRVTEHTQEDVGKFYNMGEAAYEAIPPQLTNKHFKIDLDYCGPYLMVRQEGFDLVQQMKKLGTYSAHLHLDLYFLHAFFCTHKPARA